MMKLELLPNEVLCLCFEFFDAIELFNAFDGLNQRFSQLIRHIPLYFNFKFVRKSIFDEFCARLSSDDQIRNQIYSLEFDTINKKNVEQLNLILPSVPELHRLCLLTNDLYLLENIPLSKLREMFSNIETYTGWLNSIDDLIYLMKNFANISMIDANIPLKEDTEMKLKQLEHQLNEFNAQYHIERIKLINSHCRTDVCI